LTKIEQLEQIQANPDLERLGFLSTMNSLTREELRIFFYEFCYKNHENSNVKSAEAVQLFMSLKEMGVNMTPPPGPKQI
jgi:hypothetical protein